MPSLRHTGRDPVGLAPEEAADRLRRLGPNSLPAPRALPLWRRVVRALADPLVLVLLAAMALTIATGDRTDSLVIGLVVLVNTTLGVRQELTADRAVRALDQLVAPVARTVRGGQEVSCPVAELVPGDLVLLRQGDLVPADAVLVSGVALRVDQSALTGESVALDKAGSPDPGPASVGVRRSRRRQPPRPGTAVAPDALTAGDSTLYSGTVVVHGRGLARVTATGAASALGRIAGMLESPHRATPLQRRMTQLSAYLAGGAVALCGVVLVLGVLRGQPFELMLLTAVSLVVAAVPESLPVVVTVSLALAARRMAARHAVVRNLAAVETLGSVTLLATDKTGTLTQARMELVEQWRPAGVDEPTLMRAVALCNDAVLDPATGRVTGDPTEVALLQAAGRSGVVPDAVTAQLPRVDEVPFDSVRKRMTTVHADGDARLLVCKGAPDALLRPEVVSEPAEVVTAARSQAERLAAGGARVLAVAQRRVEPAVAPVGARVEARPGTAPQPGSDGPPAATAAAGLESGLRLLGLVALRDPLRGSAAHTVAACRTAGIDVALVTGDHPGTAAAVAGQVGIDGSGGPVVISPQPSDHELAEASRHRVVARATPAQKLDLVHRWQDGGHVVAMTGDGVNDGPALHRADIGVAMGGRGTEVARQAADLVLVDDDLGTLVAAVEEGRRVYANIRRFLLYGMSGGSAEILLMLLGPAFGVPLPLLPAQILWVNLLTHSFAGAALGAEPVEAGTMEQAPRPPGQGVLAGGLWWRIGVLAALLAVASLAAGLAAGPVVGQSAALLSLGAGQLAVAWGIRASNPAGERLGGARAWLRSGHALSWAIPAAGLMLVAAVLLPPLRTLLGTEPVTGQAWAFAGLTALAALALTRLLRPRVL